MVWARRIRRYQWVLLGGDCDDTDNTLNLDDLMEITFHLVVVIVMTTTN